MLKRLTPLSAALLLTVAISASADCQQPVALPDRPQLEHYQDYSAFIADIMTFKRLEAEQQAHRLRCPQLYGEPQPLASSDGETLGEAVVAASQQPAFDYQRHSTWHARSTSQSFVLRGLNGRELANERLQADPLNAADRLLPLAALVRLPPDWRGAGLTDEQARQLQLARRQENDGAYAEVSRQDGGLGGVQRYGSLTLFFDKGGELVQVRGNVYGSSGRCTGCPAGN